MHDERSNAPIADVGLVLEGTYPYVMGGVSAWVHQIITGLPDITFSILYIGAKREPDAKRNYELPKNVVAIEEVYLHEPLTKKEQRPAACRSNCGPCSTNSSATSTSGVGIRNGSIISGPSWTASTTRRRPSPSAISSGTANRGRSSPTYTIGSAPMSHSSTSSGPHDSCTCLCGTSGVRVIGFRPRRCTTASPPATRG